MSAADAAARAATLVEELVSEGRLVRDGDRVRAPDHQPAAADPEVVAAMDRLVEALAVLAPPSLHDAAAAAGCPPAAIRELERTGRIVVLDEDLAYAMPTYRDLAAKALALAGREPLTPQHSATRPGPAAVTCSGSSRTSIDAASCCARLPATFRVRGHRQALEAERDRGPAPGCRARSSSRVGARRASVATSLPSRSTAGRCSTTRSKPPLPSRAR